MPGPGKSVLVWPGPVWPGGLVSGDFRDRRVDGNGKILIRY